ncbi:tRNA-specific adenosine deaminase [Psychrosphaera saromensis]|uniref:tRNA-specific adenosine deaminase n=1 Tax=Psychrosphaera saromensis TaxID=716813 RepID=A0A2S7UU41_9GAMM|nr:tRNA adenosine(34) deaminase TadA [Psychrosphaera saromensis]PQJ53504.1 tRNA adenosine(34) deaminase TadA [Psychrosphaera saromensis]GHB64737.1 tRNA-specific adenosine deaminase [Psychrosphaera saromensis]GLQ15747.1 tRNA-specific adenosine deaminase [Psychrosphaera saromensis]
MSDELNTDLKWMSYAIELASKAEQQGEIPVGAVLVKDDEIIGQGWNQSITLNDPTAHAEVMAIRDAGQRVDNYRLVGSTLYVTLEPCPMCAGALVHSRIDKLVFGASDLKTGAAGSVMNIVSHEKLNHQLEVVPGVLQQECSQAISAFFKKRRQQKKADKLKNTLDENKE